VEGHDSEKKKKARRLQHLSQEEGHTPISDTRPAQRGSAMSAPAHPSPPSVEDSPALPVSVYAVLTDGDNHSGRSPSGAATDAAGSIQTSRLHVAENGRAVRLRSGDGQNVVLEAAFDRVRRRCRRGALSWRFEKNPYTVLFLTFLLGMLALF
jgi:hypothetical protein